MEIKKLFLFPFEAENNDEMESIMVREYTMAVLMAGMSRDKMLKGMKKNCIAFVVDDEGKYVGCYTKEKGLNTHSKFITQCEKEEDLAKEIFLENEKICNIPVIDQEGKLLYQYIREFDDYDFNSKSYWENRYYNGKTSGTGSYNHLADFKAEIINEFIEREKVDSIIEWGCGDGNQLGFFPPVNYTGYDISKTAIDLCRKRYENDSHRKFHLYDGSKQKVEKAELVLSLDVIFHLIEDNVFEDYMYNVFTSSKKYVCIYSCDFDQRLAVHVKGRKFTEYVRKTFPEWKLINFIKNRYPYDEKDPDNTSFSDFYFYKIVNNI